MIKVKNIVNSKYFIPIIVIIITLAFFITFNCLFEIKYEEIDDFIMMNIISKSDGSYSYYSVHIHPFISYIIMLVYKTGINVNWYSVFLLTLQFISFTTIGTILIKKDWKIGAISYLLILSVIYTRLLMYLQYTSVAAITILAGIITLMHYIDVKKQKRYAIYGLMLLSIGTMLRLKSIVIVIPFYAIYTCLYTIRNKDYKAIKFLLYIIVITFIIYITNYITYRTNPLYKKYTEFNDIRTYFFDSNVLNYEENKETFKKLGWTYEDYKMLYTYSLNDENFYNIENLQNLKNNLNIKENYYMQKIGKSFTLLYFYIRKLYLMPFIATCLLLLCSILTKRNRFEISILFILNIILNLGMIFTKPVFRVMISVYASSIIMMAYYLTTKNKKGIYQTDKIGKILILFIIAFFIIINSYEIYLRARAYNKNNFSYIRDIVDYTNSNKENAYVYSTALNDIFLSYSVYEKIEDDTFSNFRKLSDWDTYNKEHYEFKERYNINNITTDLYEKDNVYLITGNVRVADNTINKNQQDLIKEYINQHYNKNVEYKVIKEFENSVKVYKFYEK